MTTFDVNQLAYSLSLKIVDGERQHVCESFLESSCKLLLEAQVWPATSERVSCELTAVYNYIVINLGCCCCQYKDTLLKFNTSKTEKIIIATLKRVYKSICYENSSADSYDDQEKPNEGIKNQLLRIVKALENPLFHFKSLDILGRLVLLVGASCLYTVHLTEDATDVICLFRELSKMAGEPVLKELCHFHHGLLCSPLSPDDDNPDRMERITILFEDVISLYLVTFDYPSHHKDMGHQSWKWLYTAMECRGLIQVKSHATALHKLQIALKECGEPHHKGRLLCVFADCYFQMGCPQLAIQTYRDALHLNSNSFSILHHLSLVYRNMNLSDLELESLNLCVLALEEAQKKEKDSLPVMGLDELIWSVKPVVPAVTFVRSKVTFAKRCLELKRFSEAVEQYSSLVKMLQDEDIAKVEFHEKNANLNVAEILVEAAEVLLVTRQYRECLRLCNNIQPSLSANESLVQNSLRLNDSPSGFFSLESSQLEVSQDINHSQSSIKSFDAVGNEKQNMKSSLRGLSWIDSHISFQRSGSRKRLRSDDSEGSDIVDDLDSCQDLLLTRLLLCKADALVSTSAINDQAVSCLQQAIDILLCHPVASKAGTNHQCTNSSLLQSPASKRQRISSDGAAISSQACSGQEIQSESAGVTSTNNLWSALLVDTALRMAKASFERKRFSSVLNSCRLITQLVSENLNALYLKTQVLLQCDILTLKTEAVVAWVKKRGFKPSDSKPELEKALKKLQLTLDNQSSNKEKWWVVCEKELTDVDIECIKFLLVNR